MTWTYDLPTVKGWYWHRFDEETPQVVYVYQRGEAFVVYDVPASFGVAMHGGQWAGPLPEPIDEARG